MSRGDSVWVQVCDDEVGWVGVGLQGNLMGRSLTQNEPESSSHRPCRGLPYRAVPCHTVPCLQFGRPIAGVCGADCALVLRDASSAPPAFACPVTLAGGQPWEAPTARIDRAAPPKRALMAGGQRETARDLTQWGPHGEPT